MREIVIDTNILVSGLISQVGVSHTVIEMLLNGNLTARYDARIVKEYRDVLSRDEFGFTESMYEGLLTLIEANSAPVIATPIRESWEDEDDKKFLEVARAVDADLLTGNLRHYPDDKRIITLQDFVQKYR
jgi:putative PIN family toxin of toxin-antitoxin system